jgi:hypothetical protein
MSACGRDDRGRWGGRRGGEAAAGRERAEREGECGGGEQEREGEGAGEPGRRVRGLGSVLREGVNKKVSRGVFANIIELSNFSFFVSK